MIFSENTFTSSNTNITNFFSQQLTKKFEKETSQIQCLINFLLDIKSQLSGLLELFQKNYKYINLFTFATQSSLDSYSNIAKQYNDEPSNLYNILLTFKDEYDKNYNKPGFNSGLYDNWAIYSPDVYFNIDGVTRFANVITCAAPNYSVYKTKSNNINLFNYILHSRIKYVLDIARDNNQENLILGAFGCGVFGNNPHTVARYFKETLENHKFKNVIFAIPNSSNDNYKAFKEVFQ
jgi:hypothetical protein